MAEDQKNGKAYPTTSSRIDQLLREMETTVSTKKDKKMQKMVEQLRKLTQLQDSTTAALEQTHEKLNAIETELTEVQILRESILQLKKEAEQEEQETDQFEATMQQKMKSLEGAMKRPSEIAVKLEREVKQNMPQKLFKLEEAVSTAKASIEEMKKSGRAEESQLLEQRLGLLEEELKITSERMDTLEQLLEGVKTRLSTFVDLKSRMEEIVSKRGAIMEKLELEEDKIDTIELSLTRVKAKVNMLSDNITTLKEEVGRKKATEGGIDPAEVIRLRKEVLELKKAIGKTRAEKVSKKELEEFEGKISIFMERHAQIIGKLTE